MTLGVCQDRSSIASFSIVTSASLGPSAIAELLVYVISVSGENVKLSTGVNTQRLLY